jgi:hypothetical protein
LNPTQYTSINSIDVDIFDMFMKDISMLGGALISQFGAGPLSLDARRSR